MYFIINSLIRDMLIIFFLVAPFAWIVRKQRNARLKRQELQVRSRERYNQAFRRRLEKEAALASTGELDQSELTDLLVCELDALEKYLVHLDKKSWQLQEHATTLVRRIN